MHDHEARPLMPVVFTHAKKRDRAPEYANQFEAACNSLMLLTTHRVGILPDDENADRNAAAPVEHGYADFHKKRTKKKRKAEEHTPELQDQAQIAHGIWGPTVKKQRAKKKQRDQEEQDEVQITRRLFIAELQEAIWGPSRYPRCATASGRTIQECDEELKLWKPANVRV